MDPYVPRSRMARTPKPKATAKVVAVTKKQKKRRKKKTPTDTRSHPLTRGEASMHGTSSASNSSGPNGLASTAMVIAGKECEQCGNSLWVGDGGKVNKKGTTWATNGCIVCDFVGYRKTQRPCVQCDRINCEYFCEWCGNGYHLKCAKQRGENVTNPNGFCCKKCELEQGEDDAKDGAYAEDTAKCGSCHLPFNSSASDDEEDDSGFKVNQWVLVENEDVLYNALITEVDARGERIKIHFMRWSKSFDDWYQMDDERINESLACDCCNQWFHIGCLPPIKSCGRFKDTTYVCPTCIGEARTYHTGLRSQSKLKGGVSSTRKSSFAEDAPASGPARKKASKPIVTSEDEGEEVEGNANGEVLEEPIVDEKPRKPPSKEKEKGKEKTREKAKDKDRAKEKKAEEHERPKEKTRAKSKDTEGSSRKRRRSGSDVGVANPNERGNQRSSSRERSSRPSIPTDSSPSISKQSERAAKQRKSPSKSNSATCEQANREKENEHGNSKKSSSTRNHPATEPEPEKVAPPRRKISCHSVSALLNSPSSTETYSEPFKPHAISHPLGNEEQPSAFQVFVKMEKDDFSLSAASTLPSHGGRKRRLNETENEWSASRASKTHDPTLSAFDILREVATQSISDELPPTEPAAAAPTATQGPISPSKQSRGGPNLPSKDGNCVDNRNRVICGNASSATTSNASTADRPTATRRVALNSFVDLHFNIRKEMYLCFCSLEEDGHIDGETAQLLRALIYPTSERFQDLKFVYLVNKDAPPAQLTKRLMELARPSVTTLNALSTASRCSSIAGSPSCHESTSTSTATSTTTSNGTAVDASPVAVITDAAPSIPSAASTPKEVDDQPDEEQTPGSATSASQTAETTKDQSPTTAPGGSSEAAAVVSNGSAPSADGEQPVTAEKTKHVEALHHSLSSSPPPPAAITTN